MSAMNPPPFSNIIYSAPPEHKLVGNITLPLPVYNVKGGMYASGIETPNFGELKQRCLASAKLAACCI